jgi:hypothetical protein
MVTDTCLVAPVMGVTVSRLLSEWVVTVTFVGPPAENSRIVREFVAAPIGVLNVSCGGVATPVLDRARAVSKQDSVAKIITKEKSGHSGSLTACSQEDRLSQPAGKFAGRSRTIAHRYRTETAAY